MKQTAWLAFEIDQSAKTPVFEQICAFLREHAITGNLREGDKLPSSREFATRLGVSRPTVVTAYEQLLAEGYLHSRVGSGYFVCAMGEVELSRAGAGGAPQEPADMSPARDRADRRPFAFGQPDMRLFPHRKWAQAVARVCRTQPEALLTGGTVFGSPDLRRAIVEHVSDWRGITASADQIAITAGSTDALELCLRTLTQRGDKIGLEDPGYMPATAFAQAQGLEPLYLPIDGEGACLPTVQHGPKLVVLTPSHQYPLGGSMSPSRRLDFIRWAKENDAWIVEDDYDSEFRYAGRPIPALAGFDGLNRTIYVGSFSKVFSNSLRIGYVILPEGLRDRFRTTLHRFRTKASYLPQQALADYMSSGEFYRHLRRVRRIYGQRHRFLLDRLKRDFAPFGQAQNHQAGMQVMFKLNPPFKDNEIAAKAAAHALYLPTLTSLSATGKAGDGLLLGFSGSSEEEMDAALVTLRACF